MKELSFADLSALSIRTKIVRVKNGEERNYEFLGFLPSSNNYAIVGIGERVETIHKTFFNNFYHGNYDAKFIGKKMIEQLEKDIEVIKRTYCE